MPIRQVFEPIAVLPIPIQIRRVGTSLCARHPPNPGADAPSVCLGKPRPWAQAICTIYIVYALTSILVSGFQVKMSRKAKRSCSTGLLNVPSINGSQDPILCGLSTLSPLSNAKKKEPNQRRPKSLCVNSLCQDLTLKGNQGVARNKTSRHHGNRLRHRPVSAISRLEGNSSHRSDTPRDEKPATMSPRLLVSNSSRSLI